MTSGCTFVQRDTASPYHTHTCTEPRRFYQTGVQSSHIKTIMSSQSEPSSTEDNLQQTPQQVWTLNMWTFFKYAKYFSHFVSLALVYMMW